VHGTLAALRRNDSQQTEEPANAGRSDNLWQPVAGDFGAHGRFGSEAYDRSQQLWASTHRGWLAAAGLGLAAVAWRRRSHDRAHAARVLARRAGRWLRRR
jgi:hypothetical protein